MKKPVMIAIIVAIVVLVVIAGIAIFINVNGGSNTDNNKDKQAISASEFKTLMEQKGYSILDATDQFKSYEKIKQVYVAMSTDYSYKIEFYEVEDDAYATSFYNTNRYTFRTSKSDSDEETENNGEIENYSKYTLTSDTNYKLVTRINNTIIYADVNIDDKDNVENVLKELGY